MYINNSMIITISLLLLEEACVYLATHALVLILKELMVPVKCGVVSNSHTLILAQASHLAWPSSPRPL